MTISFLGCSEEVRNLVCLSFAVAILCVCFFSFFLAKDTESSTKHENKIHEKWHAAAPTKENKRDEKNKIKTRWTNRMNTSSSPRGSKFHESSYASVYAFNDTETHTLDIDIDIELAPASQHLWYHDVQNVDDSDRASVCLLWSAFRGNLDSMQITEKNK